MENAVAELSKMVEQLIAYCEVLVDSSDYSDPEVVLEDMANYRTKLKTIIGGDDGIRGS